MDFLNSVGEAFRNTFTWSFLRAGVALVFAGVSSVLSWVFDLAHPSMVFLLWLVLIDSVLGAACAWSEHRFSIKVFVRLGGTKLFAYALIFIVTHVSDKGIGLDGFILNITVALSCYAISGEAGSALRKINKLFPGYVPIWALDRLDRLHSGFERRTDKDGDASHGDLGGAIGKALHKTEADAPANAPTDAEDASKGEL